MPTATATPAGSPTLVVALAMVVVVVVIIIHAGVRSLSIGSQKRGRSLFLNDILRQSPQNNTDPPLSILFCWRQGINAMFPQNVSVTAKGKDAIVGLRKVNADLFLILQGFGSNKGQFTGSTKTDADRNVLIASALRIERR